MAPADARDSCAGVRWDSMHSVADARSVTTWLPCEVKRQAAQIEPNSGIFELTGPVAQHVHSLHVSMAALRGGGRLHTCEVSEALCSIIKMRCVPFPVIRSPCRERQRGLLQP
jgi:hypothetical protein